ncbi:NUDIX hydrolase [Chloroherpeton thalassium ATCC 35110]|uniref:NUDIX hydrolase n=1 Tax=Chloroherpeton thalassium (strain ATCC 35110 / GB-78) TaxID=517418 RepID=B3QYX7_CHLT3|nr:NUDIX domain-containing protein [Chloroherpeton thalassium]ACF13670.1 NUDIX hydrolase [Chloroherpeton thalassium ATCC 35110]
MIDRKELVKLRVSAVCYQNAHVLMVKHKSLMRREGSSDSYWILPGGVLEKGETLEEGVKRELLEETGYECTVGKLVFVKEFLYPFPPAENKGSFYHSVTLGYYCDITGGKLQTGYDPEFPKDNQLILETNWLPLAELAQFDIYPPDLAELLRQGGYNHFENAEVQVLDSNH